MKPEGSKKILSGVYICLCSIFQLINQSQMSWWKEVFSKVLPLISRFDLIELVVFFLARIMSTMNVFNVWIVVLASCTISKG